MLDANRKKASTKPISVTEPGSVDWAYMMADLMKMQWRAIELDTEAFKRYLTEIRAHKAWLKIPADQPYGSEKNMLSEELGITGDVEIEIKNREVTDKRKESVNADYATGNYTRPQLASKYDVGVSTIDRDLDQSPHNKSCNTKSGAKEKRKWIGYSITEYTTPETAAQKIRAKFGDDFADQLKEAL